MFHPQSLRTGLLLTLIFLSTPVAVFAHGGHGDEFQDKNTTNDAPSSLKVDSKTAQSLGLKIQPVTKRQLDIRLKTTGQIETLPNKKVELTAPVPGRVIKLLVQPGASVKAGQPVAVLASGELVELRVASREKRAEALASLKQAQADLELAQGNLELQKKIASSEIVQAQTEVTIAQEKYNRDKELTEQGALPERTLLESKAHLEVGKTQLVKAINQKEVIEAESQIKRAAASLEAAKTLLQLSDVTYRTRLQQIGTVADEQGLVIVRSPITGKVADREATIGQAFQDAGGKLMTIVNDSRVFATANIYEKDLQQVKLGQRVSVKVANLPNRTFIGRISQIGSVVEGEKRVVPVKAELDNSNGQLKSGLFAQLEIITDKTPTAILTIPTSAVVEANGKNLVYLQNGNAFDVIEVELGKTSGDLVQVKTGLFEGDLIVTQRALQLYAQSLRGGSKPSETHTEVKPNKEVSLTPLWLLAIGGILATIVAIAFGISRSKQKKVSN